MPADERRRRLEVWGALVDAELAARGMRPAQLARYADVSASTVSPWRRRKSLPNRQAVLGVARCFRLPAAVVAERAGVLPATAGHAANRVVGDPEWRAVRRVSTGFRMASFTASKQCSAASCAMR